MKIICGMLLGLVAVASTLNWRASDELRSLRDAGESYQASMTRLAAAAQPVHAVRSDGGVRYECVTASGWRFSALGEADLVDQCQCPDFTTTLPPATSGAYDVSPGAIRNGT